MSIVNTTRGNSLPQIVKVADKLLSRLTGLLGSAKPNPEECLYISPCSGIHTFGMKYPVDVVFLDRSGKVIALYPDMKPNKISKIISSAAAVLEFSPGTIERYRIQAGDRLNVEPDASHAVHLDALKKIFHWPLNISIALSWTVFVIAAFNHWQADGGVPSLGLVLVNTLTFVLFLTRRENNEISQRVLDWIIPILAVVLSLSLRPVQVDNHELTGLSAGIQSLGILGILASLLSLGRSFGVIPANRRIKQGGSYQLVRHPLYASELIFYGGFIVGNFSFLNAGIAIMILGCFIYRVFAEEKLLGKDDQYLQYMRQIKYRLLPGVF